jgi:PcaR/PcaU/PobR family beta-ketoadipate pathway transcriptional regulator
MERSIAPDSPPPPEAVGAGEETRPTASGDIMGGFAKGLAVIEAYGRKRESLTIAEVARLSGLDRASARRCLLTLVKGGYAKTDGRYFELTPRILRLGHSYLAASLPRLVQPTLDRLADSLRESCSASVLDGTEIVYIARAAQHRMIGVGLHRGSRLPAYCTSMGRVLLAAAPPEQARALLLESDRKAITALTITDGTPADRGTCRPARRAKRARRNSALNCQVSLEVRRNDAGHLLEHIRTFYVSRLLHYVATQDTHDDAFEEEDVTLGIPRIEFVVLTEI